MNKIVYLEGSRAVGKTTLLKNIRKYHPEYVVIDGAARKEFMFDNSILDEFIINEKLYLACNVAQYNVLKTLDTTVVIVKGPYTDVFYAERFGKMQFDTFSDNNELDEFLKLAKDCEPDVIVYLDADKEQIIKRYENDTKIRSSMQTFMSEWLDDFEKFYKSKEKTIILNTNGKSAEMVYEEFIKIIDNI